jgi:hypothetical protein
VRPRRHGSTATQEISAMTLTIYTNMTSNSGQRGSIYPGGFSYQAKLYSESSCFGIDHGPISKLTVYDRKGREIIAYDRGWIMEPRFFQWKRRAVLSAIIETYGPRFTYEIERQKREAAEVEAA